MHSIRQNNNANIISFPSPYTLFSIPPLPLSNIRRPGVRCHPRHNGGRHLGTTTRRRPALQRYTTGSRTIARHSTAPHSPSSPAMPLPDCFACYRRYSPSLALFIDSDLRNTIVSSAHSFCTHPATCSFPLVGYDRVITVVSIKLSPLLCLTKYANLRVLSPGASIRN